VRADRLFAGAQREFEQVENPMMRHQLLNGLAAGRQGMAAPGANPAAAVATNLRDWWKKGPS
jgi:hypothetical protein